MKNHGLNSQMNLEMLEVEDEEERQQRIQKFLERLNTSSGGISDGKLTQPQGFSSLEFGERATQPLPPPTELLSRVQAFLPQLEASNALFAHRLHEDPNSVNMEHVEDGVDRYIEMNLGLGIFEDRSNKKEEENLHAEMSPSSSSDMSQNDDDEYSDFDSDASSEIITCFVPFRPIRPIPRRSPVMKANGARIQSLHPVIEVSHVS